MAVKDEITIPLRVDLSEAIQQIKAILDTLESANRTEKEPSKQ